ncbi:hypothetical protein [Tenacibaculum maritimum]|uniref:hypothetical protein n=1 Tax=Tenacibaculum maritimum TaxID=107401 RepID=UPI0012E488AF|nr:hypothetical protein [Tenacibaculum maritimum]CAA0163175.1 conserved membrane hypothetical protein [Tenacibaculum maritimum]
MTQEMGEEIGIIQIWTRNRKVLKYIALIILLLFFFFSYKAITPFNSSYIAKKQRYNFFKKQSVSALYKVKQYAANTKVYKEYLVARENKAKALKEFKKEIKKHKFNGFVNLHNFWDQFGKNTAGFLFVLWVIYLVLFTGKPTDEITLIGRLAICITFLFTKVFTFFWLLQQFQDFSQFQYIVTALTFSIGILAILFFLFRNRKTKEEVLLEKLMITARFTFKNTKPEKREEMLEMIKKIASHK